MYNVKVDLNELDSDNQLHLTLCDFLLKEAITNTSFSLRDAIFVYLIQDNNNNWTISLLDFELPSNPSCYKTRVVVKVDNLLEVINDDAKKQQLIKCLISSKAA